MTAFLTLLFLTEESIKMAPAKITIPDIIWKINFIQINYVKCRSENYWFAFRFSLISSMIRLAVLSPHNIASVSNCKPLL